MAVRDFAASKKDILVIHPDTLNTIDNFNVRDWDDLELIAAQEELVESIKQNGVLTPLTVIELNGQVFVTNGHRRLEAVRTAISQGWDVGKGIPCIPDGKAATLNDAERTLTMITTNSGHPLTPLETAEVLRRQ